MRRRLGQASDFPDYYDPGGYDTGEYPLTGDESLWGEEPIDEAGTDAVERFRQASLEYRDARSRFNAAHADALALGILPEWEAINGRGEIAESYIQRIAEAAASAWGVAKSIFGLSGVRRGLGLLPAIPIAYAVIVAAIAWVVAVTIDMRKFSAKVEALKSGIAPEALAESPSIFSDASGTLKWLAILAGVVFIAPKLLSNRR